MAASRQPVIDFVSLPLNFFARPAQIVGPDLVGCRLVKRQDDGSLLWGVIVETEAYSQDDPACHGYRRRSPQNETLFGEPGRFLCVCELWHPPLPEDRLFKSLKVG